MTIGSICSGIEAASVAWEPFGAEFKWFSEIAPFPSKFLSHTYPTIPNLGNLCDIPDFLKSGKANCVDVICGGTPCQAFSLTGYRKGLEDQRGQLTLKFIEVVDANDNQKTDGSKTIVFWENVEGVLKDKTNAFSCFISGLAGCDDILPISKWPLAGLVRGPKRNIAWRVIDAKYFGVPQQRRRLYVLAGGKDFHPENILFERHTRELPAFPKVPLQFTKDGKHFEVFREYTDCLYSAYGTKWNGNAAAYNGSLFVAENGRLRRLTPLETERLMGFPDNYTKVGFGANTNRYQGTGNSWAVPVVRWIGSRIFAPENAEDIDISEAQFSLIPFRRVIRDTEIYTFDSAIITLDDSSSFNTSAQPENFIPSDIRDIIDTNAEECVFISPVGCKGILRRSIERCVNVNPRLKQILTDISAQLPEHEIERISRIQPRGEYTKMVEANGIPKKKKRKKSTTQQEFDI